MADITTVNLYDLVPDSIRDDPQVSAAIIAINTELQAVSALCMVPAILARIDELDGKTLDHLAWQFDSKIYRDSWPVDLKRSVIKMVIQTKSKKGTRYAVETSLTSLGSAVAIKEWWEMSPPGDPYTFEVIATLNNIPGQVDAETQQDLLLKIDDTKSARSHYTLTFATQGQGAIALVGAFRPAVSARFNTIEA